MMFETREEEVRRKAEEAKREGLIEGLAEGLTKGKAEGILEARERIVLRMLQNGLPAEDVAEILSLAIEDVRDIARRNGIVLP